MFDFEDFWEDLKESIYILSIYILGIAFLLACMLLLLFLAVSIGKWIIFG